MARRQWSPQEDELLHSLLHQEKLPLGLIARRLKRSVQAARLRATSLGTSATRSVASGERRRCSDDYRAK